MYIQNINKTKHRCKVKFFFISFFLFLFVYVSQFYVFRSGIPQPAHLLVCFFPLILGFKFSFPSKKSKSLVHILFVFLVYSLLVNLSQGLIHSNSIFLLDSLYIFFNAIIFLSLSSVLGNHLEFGKSLVSSGVFGLSSILLFWLFGFGRYNFYPRYNAFFNDPNQMAFWTLCVASIILLLIEKKWYLVLPVIFLSMFIIALSLSRSGLVGYMPIVLGGFLSLIKFGKNSLCFLRIVKLSLIIVLFFIVFIFQSDDNKFTMIIERTSTTDLQTQAEIRGYSRLLSYPQYLFLGAGKGLDVRFGSVHEIHSTWVGLFFYYGLVGLFIVLFVLFHILKRLRPYQVFLFLGPLMYSFSTYGFRTPIFWVYLAAFFAVSMQKNNKSKSTRNLQSLPLTLQKVRQ